MATQAEKVAAYRALHARPGAFVLRPTGRRDAKINGMFAP